MLGHMAVRVGQVYDVASTFIVAQVSLHKVLQGFAYSGSVWCVGLWEVLIYGTTDIKLLISQPMASIKAEFPLKSCCVSLGTRNSVLLQLW